MSAGAAVRMFVMASAFLALAFQSAILFRASYLFVVVPAASMLAALTCHRRWPGATRGMILFAAATTPALIRVGWGLFDLTNGGIWLAPLLAVILADTRTHDWSMPRAWAVPLALWALCVAATWPIVILREADFAWSAVWDFETAVTGQGLPVPVSAIWIAHVASAHVVGVLWIDSLWRAYAGARDRVEREIVLPLLAAVMASVAVAVYQANVDRDFLSPTVYAAAGRATGLLLDGNVLGVLAAMCGPALLVVTHRSSGAWRLAAALGALACLVAVWGSGSRTAVLAAAVTVPFSLVALWAGARTLTVRLAVVTASLAALTGVGVAIASGRLSGPLDRFQLMFDRSWAAGQGLAQYLWNRDGYGPAASRMFEEHPVVGAGVGAFHSLVLDYSRWMNPSGGVGSDNAQNWARHLLAELGVLGSLGALVFAAILAVSFVSPLPRGSRIEGWLVASALAGLGAASLMGVPTQHAFALIVFWTFAFWHQVIRMPDASGEPRITSPLVWSLLIALATAFTAGTVVTARDELRVSHRAVRFGWPYLRGFHGLETGEGGFRWTRQRAKAVIAAQPGYLKLSYFVHHGDAAANPVRVAISVEGRQVVDEEIRDPHARTIFVPVAPNLRSVTIETSVSRPWFPPHEGGRRELGLGLSDWTFVYRPPPGAVIVR